MGVLLWLLPLRVYALLCFCSFFGVEERSYFIFLIGSTRLYVVVSSLVYLRMFFCVYGGFPHFFTSPFIPFAAFYQNADFWSDFV